MLAQPGVNLRGAVKDGEDTQENKAGVRWDAALFDGETVLQSASRVFIL